jgi:hypothetical protein
MKSGCPESTKQTLYSQTFTWEGVEIESKEASTVNSNLKAEQLVR